MNIIVIPAYEPSNELAKLVDSLKELSKAVILVVNDGSGTEFETRFKFDLPIHVIGYPKNRGKGYAIKYALQYIKEQGWRGTVITADADGQHKPEDIMHVLAETEANPGALVLGSREFNRETPWKSCFGNIITRGVFRIASGKKIRDTQTGLRAFSTEQIPFLIQISGDRYEYEMNVLMEWSKEGGNIREVGIDTVYHDVSNSCSHFNALKDSGSIYWQILKRATPVHFMLSSLLSFLLDYVLFLIFLTVFNTIDVGWGLVASNILARAGSAVFNYNLNRLIVFRSKASFIRSGLGYAGLAACILLGNSAVLAFYTTVLGIEPALAKIMTELTLFVTSYIVQKKLIFRSYNKKEKEGVIYASESDQKIQKTRLTRTNPSA